MTFDRRAAILAALSKDELAGLVARIHDALYLEFHGDYKLSPDTEWDSSTLNDVVEVFDDFNLVPT